MGTSNNNQKNHHLPSSPSNLLHNFSINFHLPTAIAKTFIKVSRENFFNYFAPNLQIIFRTPKKLSLHFYNHSLSTHLCCSAYLLLNYGSYCLQLFYQIHQIILNSQVQKSNTYMVLICEREKEEKGNRNEKREENRKWPLHFPPSMSLMEETNSSKLAWHRP